MIQKSEGFALIEMVVVVSLIIAISLISVLSIVRFQKNTVLNDTVSEFTSVLKNAQSNSMAGKILEGEDISDFEADGFPVFGVEVLASQYTLFRDYIPAGESTSTRETLETYTINDTITVSPVPSEIVFNRLSGTSPSLTITFTHSPSEIRQVVVDGDGLISYQSL